MTVETHPLLANREEEALVIATSYKTTAKPELIAEAEDVLLVPDQLNILARQNPVVVSRRLVGHIVIQPATESVRLHIILVLVGHALRIHLGHSLPLIVIIDVWPYLADVMWFSVLA